MSVELFLGKRVLELSDEKWAVREGDRSIELPCPNNLHNFFVSAGSVFYRCAEHEGELKSAVFKHKEGRIVFSPFKGKEGIGFMLFVKYGKEGQEKMSVRLGYTALGQFLEWLKERIKAVPIGDTVVYRNGDKVYIADLLIEKPRVVYYALLQALKDEEENKVKVYNFGNGRLAIKGKRLQFFEKREDQKYYPAFELKLTEKEDFLRIMSVL